MKFKMTARVIAEILIGEALFMIPAVVICFIDSDLESAIAFGLSMLIMLLPSTPVFLAFRNLKEKLNPKESFVCVGFAWMFLSIAGCLPFLISGQIPLFEDALFETVSGFTTTGASVLSNVETLSKGMLYWRSFTHWVGGLGVLVLVLAITPSLNKNGGSAFNLMKSESPGPDVGKLVPKTGDTSKILYLVYMALTAINFIALLIAGMPAFDSLCTAIGTAGTGGFGIKADSMAGYSPAIQTICTIFMFLFGINLSLYFLLVTRKFKAILNNAELWFYVGIFTVSVAVISFDARECFSGIGEAVHHVAFQVSSIVTTTGFSTVDFDKWPSLSKAILICLMITGGCAGSTAGGLKCSRVMIIVKSFKRNIAQTLRPQKIDSIRMNGQALDEKIVSSTALYFSAYALIILVSFLLISIDGYSVTTNITAVLACFNNIGPGLEAVGPAENFGGYSLFSKMVLIFDMLAGRLEIFPILVLFSPETWKKAG